MLQWMILNALHRLLFFSHLSLNIVRASVDVEGIAAVECGFGHEEDDKKKHDHEGSTHGVHRDSV